MRITTVRLQNFCQFEALEFRLSPGLNLIAGPNGAGKSNVMKAVYGALTNDFARNEGPKDSNVRQTAGAKDPALVRVDFEHHGAEYRVTRHLRPARQEFVVPGEPPVTRDALVNQRVAQVLGVTPDLLDKYIFVDQWAMFDFLTATETDRAKAFQRLFGTVAAERAWAAAGEVLARTKVPQGAADLDARRAEVAQAEARVADLTARLAAYADLPEAGVEDDDARAVRVGHARQRVAADAEQTRRRLADLQARAAAARREQASLRADRETLTAGVATGRSAADEARAAVAVWQALKATEATRTRVEQQLEKARLEVPLHPRPTRCGLYLAEADAPVLRRREFLAAEVRRAEQLLASFDPATGRAECPTCFTPVTSLADYLAEAAAALPGLKAELADIERRVEYTAEADRLERAYAAWHGPWQARVAGLERQLADLRAVPRPARPEGELAAAAADYADMEAALKYAEQELAAADVAAAGLAGQVAAEADRLAVAEAELTALAVIAPDALAAAEVRLARRAVMVQDRARLRGELQSEERRLREAAAEADRLAAAEAEGARVRRWVRHLEDVRAVLHRDSLPRVVAEHYLSRLRADTNAFLATFDAPFRVEPDAGLSFRAVFRDGTEQPAGRLSGGEKVVLALAFRLSVNSVFASDVGLLCLDEPTVGLDAHNLGCLGAALERLRDVSRARGLQVVMVTHEQRLARLFDTVVDLTPAS